MSPNSRHLLEVMELTTAPATATARTSAPATTPAWTSGEMSGKPGSSGPAGTGAADLEELFLIPKRGTSAALDAEGESARIRAAAAEAATARLGTALAASPFSPTWLLTASDGLAEMHLWLDLSQGRAAPTNAVRWARAVAAMAMAVSCLCGALLQLGLR